ncbi:hypothetical protein OIDMADRAFT_44475 [Oidiodendron maius Zn]|uniref:Zn(2)-C6 fungal-type domain-containing protein n=1 Tax=Oidiodendron maius (strain Zn) TaxID=913774 RepID=A0A0C3H3D5_OIDMZ|nr:hypothetical protein OIDMADRAFT_44475 [Oidiodendron maius Zn]
MKTRKSDTSRDQTRQVCSSCKARKKKCNKALPKCSLCSKRNLACSYSTPEQNCNPVSPSDRLRYGLPVNDEQAEVQSIDFPTMLFLDPIILQHGQVEISQVATPVPTHILHLLGDVNEIRITASKFFEHIHSWMPFISKKRFHEFYLRPSFQSRPDAALLLLALKLITTLPPTSPRNPRTAMYHATKHFYLEVEGSNHFSIPVLQAGVLLALYELGHAIYPAAYLSIGACARYAHALGINISGAMNTRRVLTLVEVEERRRVWWAIIILDRFVSIGCPGRPFSTADPGLDDLLPADDAAWDQGIVRLDDSFTLSSPMTDHMSKFALLCQAARLLGQVLHHVSGDMAIHDNIWIQLDRTLHTLVALYTPWLYSDCVSRADKDRCQHARVVVQQITERIHTNLVEKQCFSCRNPEDMPPWGLFFAYHICRANMRLSRKTSKSSKTVKYLRETFLAMDARWNAAGVYLQLLEAQEVINCF